jgi:hypothetical protein
MFVNAFTKYPLKLRSCLSKRGYFDGLIHKPHPGEFTRCTEPTEDALSPPLPTPKWGAYSSPSGFAVSLHYS